MATFLVIAFVVVTLLVLGALMIHRAEVETERLRQRVQKNLYEVTNLSVRIPGRGFVPADINARYNR